MEDALAAKLADVISTVLREWKHPILHSPQSGARGSTKTKQGQGAPSKTKDGQDEQARPRKKRRRRRKKLVQCHRCQGFGHSHTSCEAKGPACGICGRDHHTSHCIELKIDGKDVPRGCANCGSTVHSAPSYYCPVRKQHLRGSKVVVSAKPSTVDACSAASEPYFQELDIVFPDMILPHEKKQIQAQCALFFEFMAKYDCSFSMKPLPPVAEHDVEDEEQDSSEEEEVEPPTHPGQKRTATGTPDLSAASTSSDSIPSAEQPDASPLARFFKVKDKRNKRRKTIKDQDQAQDQASSSPSSTASPRLASSRPVSLPRREGSHWIGSNWRFTKPEDQVIQRPPPPRH